MARSVFLSLVLCLFCVAALADDNPGTMVTLSATKDGVVIYLDADKLGSTPHVTRLQPGSHTIEFIVSSELRLEHELEIVEQDRVLVFADVEEEDVTVLTNKDKISEFLSDFSRKIQFRRFFETALEYYSDK